MKFPKGGYQPGDVVEWGGVKGFVITTKGANPQAPLQVMFPTARDAKGMIPVVGFTSMGGFLSWNVQPVITFVRRPGTSLTDKLIGLYPKLASVFRKEPLTLTLHPTETPNQETPNESA